MSSSCKIFVQNELNKLGVYNINVELGEVELSEDLPKRNYGYLTMPLRSAGLEILKDKNRQLVEKLKRLFMIWFIYA